MISQVALQPLRVPTGWTVTWGGLQEVDPTAGMEDHFGQDLLQMRHERSNRLLDVGWYPAGDVITGCYGLVVYEGDFKGRKLLEFHTRDRQELVREIERLLDQIAGGRL